MFKEKEEGQTQYCKACEAEGRSIAVPTSEHTCGKPFEKAEVEKCKHCWLNNPKYNSMTGHNCATCCFCGQFQNHPEHKLPQSSDWQNRFDKFYPDWGKDILEKAQTGTEIMMAESETRKRNLFIDFISSELSIAKKEEREKWETAVQYNVDEETLERIKNALQALTNNQ